METVSEKLWNRNYVRVWTANFMLFFSFMLLTPLFPLYLSEVFGTSKQTIGLVLSGYTLTALLVRPFGGYLVDSLPRKTVLLSSFFLFFVLFIGYPLAGSLWLFAVVRTLHGAPFGLATISNSTVAIDVLPSSRRAEGIGYYGLSNNVATAIAPTIALFIYGYTGNYELLFIMAIIVSGAGLYCNYTLRLSPREKKTVQKLSLDRFILLRSWPYIISMVCLSFSYGVIATYVAVYGKEELGITGGTGLFFMLLSIGLILSRLTGSRTLREGKIVQNASLGLLVSLVGYFTFAAFHSAWGYYGAAFIIGLGNGHMFPAYQTIFLNLAPNSQRGTANSTLFVSWDTGMGLGMLIGGYIVEHWGYHQAFWAMWIGNAIGVAVYFLYAKGYFMKKKLR